MFEEFEKSLRRTITADAHEIVTLYCEHSKQKDKYRDVDWFEFALMIRNTNSHTGGGILWNWPDRLRKKGITSVSWIEKTLDESMVGDPILFNHYDCVRLFQDMVTFVKDDLD